MQPRAAVTAQGVTHWEGDTLGILCGSQLLPQAPGGEGKCLRGGGSVQGLHETPISLQPRGEEFGEATRGDLAQGIRVKTLLSA